MRIFIVSLIALKNLQTIFGAKIQILFHRFYSLEPNIFGAKIQIIFGAKIFHRFYSHELHIFGAKIQIPIWFYPVCGAAFIFDAKKSPNNGETLQANSIPEMNRKS